MKAMRVMSNGIVTIPRSIRAATGIDEGTMVEFVQEGNTIVLRRQVTGLRSLAGLIDLDAKQIDAEIAEMRGKDTKPRRKRKR